MQDAAGDDHGRPGGTPPGLADQLEALRAWRNATSRPGAPAPHRAELGRLLEDPLPAVVAVQHPARRHDLEQALTARGLSVVDARAPGAIALVLVEADGPQAVREARAGWPTALVATEVAVDDDDAAPALLAAGAVAVFSRHVPAAQVVEALLSCWRGERRAVVLL